MSTFNKFLGSLVALATPLGFYRGVQSYHWELSRLPKTHKDEYLYTVAAGHGLMGTCVYLCPLLVFQNVAKEFHRAEVNVRRLDSLKQTPYYNELL